MGTWHPPIDRLVRHAGVVVLLALTPSTVAAQGRPDTLAARIDSVVVTAVRAPTAVGGASAVIIQPSRLAHPVPVASSLGEVLRQIPFVLVRQNSRGESELSIRGSDSRQAAVLVDGIPVTLGWDSRLDPSLVPLTGVRQLTVTRGLSSVLGGPNVLGGIIEFGFGGPVDGGRDLVASAGMDGYGAYGISTAAGVRHASSLGAMTVRGGISQRARDGFALSRGGGRGDGVAGEAADPGHAGDGRLRSNSDLHEVDVFAAIRLQATDGRFAGLTVTGFNADRGVPAELHLASPRRWRYPEVSRRLIIASAGTGVVRTGRGHAELTASLGVNTGALEIETYSDASYTSVSSREFGDERTVTARTVGSHTLGDRGRVRVSHTWSEIRYDERFNDDAATRYRQTLQSLGAESEWRLGSSTQLAAGLVYDQAETPESGGREPLGRLHRTGWRVGLSTLGLGEAVRFHLSVSERSRFPALRELYSGALNRFDPNPDLRPETLLGAELGATLLGGRLASAGLILQAVAFRHQVDDAVVRVTLPNRLFRRINRDEIRSSGLELIADWSSRGAGSADGVTLTADLLLQRVRVHDQTIPAGEPNRRRAEHVPELRATLDLGVPLAFGVRAAGALRMTGKQFCQHADLGQLVALGAQGVGDAGISREWRAGREGRGALRLHLAVDNITDGTVYDQCGLPQPGRTVRLGVELR